MGRATTSTVAITVRADQRHAAFSALQPKPPRLRQNFRGLCLAILGIFYGRFRRHAYKIRQVATGLRSYRLGGCLVGRLSYPSNLYNAPAKPAGTQVQKNTVCHIRKWWYSRAECRRPHYPQKPASHREIGASGYNTIPQTKMRDSEMTRSCPMAWCRIGYLIALSG